MSPAESGKAASTQRWPCLVAVAVLLIVSVTTNLALAGDVRGQIRFDGRFGEPPEHTPGFVPRIANPIRPVQSFDPTPYLVVVLEGEASGDSSSSGKVDYVLEGEAFEVPLLAVEKGAEIRIRNAGPAKAVLSAPDFPDLLDNVSLDPRQTTTFTTDTADKAVIIRTPGTTHPEGRVVAFATHYFATVDGRGKFSISKVPEGTWKARLWYRDGWVKGVEETFTVARRDVDVSLRVSPNQLPRPGTSN